MNAQDEAKRKSDTATCRACLLADAMKPCKNGCYCQFEVGLIAESTPNLWQIGKAVIFGSAEWFAAIPETKV